MANINKNIIMQAGADVANAANKAAGLPASTPEPGSIISVIQLVNGGRTVGPDALAYFTESVRNKLLSLLVSMEPIQDFNGYGHPWPAGGGANQWDEEWELGTIGLTTGAKVDVSDKIRSKNYVPILPNTEYYYKFPGNWRMVYYDSDKNIVGQGDTYAPNIIRKSPATAHYLMFALDAATEYGNNIAINYPATVTTYSPYANTCPLSGRTGLNAYVSPTPNVSDATTYAADWTSPAGTVYAGSADIVSGDIKAAPYYASYNGETLVGPWVSSMDVYDPEGTPTTGAQVVDLGGTMTEYHITGQDVITMVGDNYIWSDSGDVTITE